MRRSQSSVVSGQSREGCEGSDGRKELRYEIRRLEWESRDWQNHQRLRESYARQAKELKAQLRNLSVISASVFHLCFICG
jgi:hypothetical protein